MFPQEHTTTSLIDTGSSSSLEQIIMLQQQQFSYAPMPINPDPIIMERSITSSTTRWKPNIEVAPNCPRCASTNTKFCYYNNYSLSQPRYFCKGCRRYWTKGGSLRNVPVGGGCRKNRRGKAARHSQSERLSAINNNSDDSRESLSAGDKGSETNNGSRDIDMALVFAKFLNQKPTSNEEYGSSSTSNNLSNSLTTTTPESGENIDKDVVVQPQKKGSEFDGDDPLGLLLGGVHVEGSMENFIDELDGFDDVWRDDDAAVTYCWQPPPLPSPPPPTMMQMQLQQLEEYAIAPLLNEEGGHHHHHRELTLPAINSSNSMDLLISEGWSTNWGSFDLSTTDVFSSSRPSFIN